MSLSNPILRRLINEMALKKRRSALRGRKRGIKRPGRKGKRLKLTYGKKRSGRRKTLRNRRLVRGKVRRRGTARRRRTAVQTPVPVPVPEGVGQDALFQEGYNETYQEGFNAGFAKGFEDGHKLAYQQQEFK